MTFPGVIIIGARRSGTTSMYNYLSQHPKIVRAVRLGRLDPRREVHFFDREDHWAKGIKWYQSWWKAGRIGLEKTPTYLQAEFVPVRIKKLMPDVKIIVMLRHPVDRVYSDYIKRKRERYERRSFSEAIAKESLGYSRDGNFWMSDRHLFGYLERSDYVPQLQRWQLHFSEDQIFCVQFEAFRGNPNMFVNAVFEFLGIETRKITTDAKWQTQTYTSMGSNMREYLSRYFKDRMEPSQFPFRVDYGPWW